MADYIVRLLTDADSKNQGRSSDRTFHLEESHWKRAVQAAIPRLQELVKQGYVRVNSFRGEVQRDRTSPNQWYSGRVHDDRNDPRYVFKVEGDRVVKLDSWEDLR